MNLELFYTLKANGFESAKYGGVMWSDIQGGFDNDGFPRVYISVLFNHNGGFREIEICNHDTFFKSKSINSIEQLQKAIDVCYIKKEIEL